MRPRLRTVAVRPSIFEAPKEIEPLSRDHLNFAGCCAVAAEWISTRYSWFSGPV